MIVGRLTVIRERVTKPFSQDKIQKAHFCFSFVWIFDLFRFIDLFHQHAWQLAFQLCMQHNLEKKQSNCWLSVSLLVFSMARDFLKLL